MRIRALYLLLVLAVVVFLLSSCEPPIPEEESGETTPVPSPPPPTPVTFERIISKAGDQFPLEVIETSNSYDILSDDKGAVTLLRLDKGRGELLEERENFVPSRFFSLLRADDGKIVLAYSPYYNRTEQGKVRVYDESWNKLWERGLPNLTCSIRTYSDYLNYNYVGQDRRYYLIGCSSSSSPKLIRVDTANGGLSYREYSYGNRPVAMSAPEGLDVKYLVVTSPNATYSLELNSNYQATGNKWTIMEAKGLLKSELVGDSLIGIYYYGYYGYYKYGVIKFSVPLGNLYWKKEFSNNYVLRDLEVDGDYIYAVGTFEGEGDQDIAFLKISQETGEVLLSKRFGAPDRYDRGYLILRTSDGNLLIVGIAFNMAYDIYVLKVTPEGERLW